MPASPQIRYFYLNRYVPYCDVENDLWGKSHFNFEAEKDINYHVLRTGAFPFIKFHCSKRPWEDLQKEDVLYRILKVLNLGKYISEIVIRGIIYNMKLVVPVNKNGPIIQYNVIHFRHSNPTLWNCWIALGKTHRNRTNLYRKTS